MAGTRYRLSPFIRVHLDEESVRLENYILKTDVALRGADPIGLLGALQTPKTLDELTAALGDRVSRAEQVELVDAGVLVSDADAEAEKLLELKEEWTRFNWELAFYFHWFTRDYKFIDYSEPGSLEADRALMDQYAALAPRPSNYKEGYPEPIALPQPSLAQATGSYADAFRFTLFNAGSDQPVTLEQFSSLLFAMAGQIGTKMWPGQGHFIRRTAPSGGARHPTEVYISVLDIDGLPQGLYHYDVRRHGVSRLKTADHSTSALMSVIPDLQDRVRFRPHSVFILTSMVERSMWRYRDSRSFRVILLDVGHLTLNFRLSAEQLRLPYFVGQGFSDSGVARLLELNVDEELPIVFAAV